MVAVHITGLDQQLCSQLGLWNDRDSSELFFEVEVGLKNNAGSFEFPAKDSGLLSFDALQHKVKTGFGNADRSWMLEPLGVCNFRYRNDAVVRL